MQPAHRVREFVLDAAALGAAYLLLAGEVNASEVTAAGLTAVLSAWLLGLIRSRSGHRFSPKWVWVLHVVERVWLRSLKDCVILLVPLWRLAVRQEPIRGEILDVPFDPGDSGPRAAARRAMVLAGVTVAPNTLAIEIDRKRQSLRIHRLVPQPDPPGGGDREWPI